MLVKKFEVRKEKSGGIRGLFNYLQNKPDGQQRTIKGDPETTIRITETLASKFKTAYYGGVLSFSEDTKSLDEKEKLEIIESFEDMLFPDVDKKLYDITWIEHSDKDNRLELNFVIPLVNLEKETTFTPYLHKNDVKYFNEWKRTINGKYGLSDPEDERRKRLIKWNFKVNDKTQKKLLDLETEFEILAIEGKIETRKDVVKFFEERNIEITRKVKSSITVKIDNQKVRLQGQFFEQNVRISKILKSLAEDTPDEIAERKIKRKYDVKTRSGRIASQREFRNYKANDYRADTERVTKDIKAFSESREKRIKRINRFFTSAKLEDRKLVSRERESDRQEQQTIINYDKTQKIHFNNDVNNELNELKHSSSNHDINNISESEQQRNLSFKKINRNNLHIKELRKSIDDKIKPKQKQKQKQQKNFKNLMEYLIQVFKRKVLRKKQQEERKKELRAEQERSYRKKLMLQNHIYNIPFSHYDKRKLKADKKAEVQQEKIIKREVKPQSQQQPQTFKPF